MLTNRTVLAVDRDTLDAFSARARRLRWPTATRLARINAAQGKALRAVKGAVAVVPVYGMIEKRLSAWSYWFGGTSTDLVGQTIQSLIDDSRCEAIVLDVDSPGGTPEGTQELSDLIFNARGNKPILGIANPSAYSAAYWTVSSCDQVICTPSGGVGSVGAYMMHVDYSQQLAEEGIKVEFIAGGKYKTLGNAYEPLSDDGREYLQDLVDQAYTAFVKAVARNRDVTTKQVLDKFGQGKCLMATAAKAAGMIDRIATLDQVLQKLTGNTPAGTKAAKAASVEILRLRQTHRKALLL